MQPTLPTLLTLNTEEARYLDADCNGMSMSPAEFDAVEDCDENWRYELVRGIVIVSPPPRDSHEEPIDELGSRLRDYRRQHPQGHSLDATLPNRYIRTPSSRRLADRVIWAGLGRRPDSRVDVPTIAVEIVSPGKRNRRRDYVEKRQEYRAAGVTEYWIIDRASRSMTVCRADGSEQQVAEAETYTTPLLPGFELQLADLLTAADQWDD